MTQPLQTEKAVVKALRDQMPVKDLPGASIDKVQEQPEKPFDVSFEVRSGSNRIQVLGEIKTAFSPRQLEEIAPWIQRIKSFRPDVAIAVIAPALSTQAQAFCIQNGIDFLDLAGNISINVPGKFTLQRSGMRASGITSSSASNGQWNINVFSGRSSRILRVLLEKSQRWSITGLAKELELETTRFRNVASDTKIAFEISFGAVSKAIASLEEQLLIRRRDGDIVVPEPARLLLQWAEKYKERYRRRLSSSFQTGNPFGRDLKSINAGIQRLILGTFAFSGAMAASIEAPYVDIDIIDIFLAPTDSSKLQSLKTEPPLGPALRFIAPYDDGLFLYSKRVGKALVVSDVQAYLDLYARGGRDLKQAEVLLKTSIQRRWDTA